MATTTSFKQQCPSCEAMVPIRDPGLIGRKIDCPKCKYRFVVENPGADEKEEDAAQGAKKTKGPAKGEKAAAKGKPGPKPRDEEDAPGRPKKKPEGSSKS